MTDRYADYLIIGARIAGASAAYELAKKDNVILIEKEELNFSHLDFERAFIKTSKEVDSVRALQDVVGKFEYWGRTI